MELYFDCELLHLKCHYMVAIIKRYSYCKMPSQYFALFYTTGNSRTKRGYIAPHKGW